MNNIVINLRPPGADLLVAHGRRLDEAYKGFIMVACALIYSAVFLGPWGWLKDMANPSTSSGLGFAGIARYLAYAGTFLAINLVILPALFLACAWLARRIGRLDAPLRKSFVEYAYTLVPLGLLAWIAFSLAFVFVNGSYAVAVLSDPFGWGWNLFGTKSFPWTPFLPQVVQYLQVGLLIGGLTAAIYLAYRIGRQNGADHPRALWAALPISGFLAAVTLVFMRLYLG